MNKSVGIIIHNIWKNKKCSKPPTSYGISGIYWVLMVNFHGMKNNELMLISPIYIYRK